MNRLKFWHGVGVMTIMVILLQIRGCIRESKHDRDVESLMSYIDTVMTYTAKDGTTVEYNKVLETDLNTFFEVYGDSMKEYFENIRIKNPQIYTVYSEKFYVDSIPKVELRIKDCKFDTTFNIVEPYYQIYGNLSNDALALKSITVPNKTSFVVGNMKSKWWKKPEYIISVSNSNPHVKSDGLQSYTFKSKESRWSFGPSIGYGFYYDPWKNNIGHGITGGLSFNFKIFGKTKK